MIRAKHMFMFALAVGACGKSGDKAAPAGSGSAPGSGSAAANGPRDAAIAAWKQGKLDVSAFAAAKSPVGDDCARGTVNKLDVLVCNFASADAAKQAENLGLQWIGDTTGSSQARGALVIAIADHHKADPNGKTINQILKLVPAS